MSIKERSSAGKRGKKEERQKFFFLFFRSPSLFLPKCAARNTTTAFAFAILFIYDLIAAHHEDGPSTRVARFF
jgi:hypothetical protein